jgi:hypothetical protein
VPPDAGTTIVAPLYTWSGVILHEKAIGAISGASWWIQIQENGQKSIQKCVFIEKLTFYAQNLRRSARHSASVA